MTRPMTRRRGFTLLEIILASAVMSVIAVSLFGALRVTYRARNSALAVIAAPRSAQIAMDLVRQDLESALPPTGVLAGAFLGQFGIDSSSASSLEFYCVGGDSSSLIDVDQSRTGGAGGLRDERDPTITGGIRRINLLVRQAPDNQTMVLVRQTTRHLLSPTFSEPEEEILCRGVKAFTLRFFDGFAWQDAWDSTAQGDMLPMAVEVTLELETPAATQTTTAQPYRVTRIFYMACYHDATLDGGGL